MPSVTFFVLSQQMRGHIGHAPCCLRAPAVTCQMTGSWNKDGSSKQWLPGSGSKMSSQSSRFVLLVGTCTMPFVVLDLMMKGRLAEHLIAPDGWSCHGQDTMAAVYVSAVSAHGTLFILCCSALLCSALLCSAVLCCAVLCCVLTPQTTI